MKKLNFNHKTDGDDIELLNILSESLVRKPSAHLVENTMNKLLDSRKRRSTAHKPLRFPLYLMLAIGLILIGPAFFTSVPNLPIPYIGFEGNDFFKRISFQPNSWYMLSIVLLGLVSTLVMWIGLEVSKFQNPHD